MSVQGSHEKPLEAHFEGRFYPLKCFQNAWYSCFLIHHDLTGKDDVPAVDTRKSLGIVEGNLETLLQTSDNSSSPSEADEVKRYCKGGSGLEAVEKAIGEAGTRLAAWVDDRNSPNLIGKGNVRVGGTWLTATGLLKHLRQSVRHP
jgi:hypothetical protein